MNLCDGNVVFLPQILNIRSFLYGSYPLQNCNKMFLLFQILTFYFNIGAIELQRKNRNDEETMLKKGTLMLSFVPIFVIPEKVSFPKNSPLKKNKSAFLGCFRENHSNVNKICFT